MLKNKASLEIEIGGKIFTFLCDADAALNHVHDAISHFKTFVAGKIAEASPPAAPAPEQPKVE